MSVDLERAFDQLRTHTNVVALPPAPAVRRRGDQRRRTRTAAALIGLVALVSLTSAGVVLTLGAPATVQPGLTPTSTPTQSLGPAPTAAPRVEAPAPAPNEPATFPAGCLADPDTLGLDISTGGAPLPPSLTLTAADWGPCYVLLADEGGFDLDDIGRPDVCFDNRPYNANTDRVAGRTRIYTIGPETQAHESVVQYAPGRAAAYLAEVRDRVAECATHPLPGGGTDYALILDQDSPATRACSSMSARTRAAAIPASSPP